MKEFIHSRNDLLVEIYLALMSERQRNVKSPPLDPQFRVRFAKWAVPSNSPSRLSFPWYKMRESGLEDKISKIRFKNMLWAGSQMRAKRESLINKSRKEFVRRLSGGLQKLQDIWRMNLGKRWRPRGNQVWGNIGHWVTRSQHGPGQSFPICGASHHSHLRNMPQLSPGFCVTSLKLKKKKSQFQAWAWHT